MTFGIYDCPICIDSFLLDWPLPTNPRNDARVRVLCVGCKQTIEMLAVSIDVIHNCPVDHRPKSEIVAMLPPDPNASRELGQKNMALRIQVCRKRNPEFMKGSAIK